jgi:hypothetical protein
MTTETLTINGYEKNTFCAHCGRKLVHAIVTSELGEIGATCFVSLIRAKPRAGYAGGYKPTSAGVIDLAKMKEFQPDRIAGPLRWERT